MKITLAGVPPYDGTYMLDLDRMSNRELHTVKRISGYVPVEYDGAGKRGDTDLFVAFVVVALQRAGNPRVNEDAIWDADFDTRITIDFAEDADAVPPPQPAPAEPSGSMTSSGPASNSDSDSRQGSDQASTGTPGSDTGATSPPIRSVS